MAAENEAETMSGYEAARNAVALYEAGDRGLLEVTGKDRAAWLHNLLTNTVKTLQPGDGVYAFATNVKGRILFDCHVLVLPNALRLDIDRGLVSKAMAHFGRYHIAEDITLADRSDEFSRIALVGPRAADMAASLGATHAGKLPAVGSTRLELEGRPRLAVRNDAIAGVFGLELYIEVADLAACRRRLLEVGGPMGIQPVNAAAIDVLRIEAGIPVYGRDIDEEVLPAETQQIERAISYVKGCYLGQEVVERMRSRGGLARRLVGLKLSSGIGVHPQAALTLDGNPVGRLTSICHSPTTGGIIGLGYVKTAHAEPGSELHVASTDASAEILRLGDTKL